MAAIILEKFRTHNAKEFIADFGDSSNYIFIGRSHSWTDDNEPPAPANSESEEIQAFEDMIALKKIGTTDVSHGLVRYNWTSGTVYDEYRDDYSASNQTPSGANNFYDGRGYVVTSDYKVYKCLKTGKSGGAFYDAGSAQGSTVEPSSVSTTDPEVTNDGYTWKFMYQMSANDVIKYVTNDFVPVKTLGAKNDVAGSGTNGGFGSSATDDGSAQWDVENDAVDGAIYRYIITAAGSGYNNGSGTSFDLDVNVEGDGSGAVATLTFSSGALSSVTFKDTSSYGSGYKRASFPTLSSALSGLTAGSGATLRAVISPIEGHGANPVDELGGNYVVVNSRLEFGDGSGDFPTDNDFRQIGLVKNPVAGGSIASATTLTATRKLTVDDGTNISVDDVIRDVASSSEDASTAVARVISKTGNVLKVQTIANSGGEFVNFVNDDEVFIGTASSKDTDVASAGVDSAHPEVERFTGHMLYLENRGPVSRAADQIEDIKLIIEM